VRGEVLEHPTGVEIEIMEADARRIRRVRLRTPEMPAPAHQE
jgi:hemolysin (HlyC) family protein